MNWKCTLSTHDGFLKSIDVNTRFPSERLACPVILPLALYQLEDLPLDGAMPIRTFERRKVDLARCEAYYEEVGSPLLTLMRENKRLKKEIEELHQEKIWDEGI